MTFRGLVIVTLASFVLLATVPGRVQACGGLFCNSAQQVNQAAERIIFADNGDGTITAVIEIQYDGPAERFSWLLPVPGRPELGVSSKTALDRLQQFTNPSYRLQTRFEQGCFGFADAGSFIDGDDAGSAGEGAMDYPVTVLGKGTVGPFDYTIIRVDPDLDDRAQVATDWLAAEGFDVPSRTTELLNPYLSDDLNLLAIRLSKGNSAGAIRPIWITYESSRPFIPIRPTAVAANDDMGVLVFVAGEKRAIPGNYKALELNEALIDWFNPMRTYDDVVGAAADESGGQGFVTEYAQASSTLDLVVLTDEDRNVFSKLSTTSFESTTDLVWLAGRFRTWDGFEDALGEALTRPSTLSLADYYDCPRCYEDDDTVVLDRARFIELLTQRVYQPMADTQQLLTSRGYVTRLYTTMSPEEMTVDPLFDFNGDLPDVSNVHIAEQLVGCDRSFRVTLPQGGVVYGETNGTWPIEFGGDYPAARVISELGTSGDGRIVVDNSDAILDMLDRALPPPKLDAGRPDAGRAGAGRDGGRDAGGDGGDAGGDVEASTEDGCSCAVPGAPARSTRAAWLFMAALGAGLWRWRRR